MQGLWSGWALDRAAKIMVWLGVGVLVVLGTGCGSEEESGTLVPGDENQSDGENQENQNDGENQNDDPNQNVEPAECPSGEFSDEGVCLPQPPQGTPEEECPSGEFRAHPSIAGKGICLPEMPLGTPEEECPSGEFEAHEDFQGEGICLPERPRLEDWDCPQGWETEALPAGVTEDAGEFAACRPPELPSECPEGQWPSLRDGGCVQHGIACPEDESWPSEELLRAEADGFEGEVVYVDANGGEEGADGSREAPFATVGEGVSAAEAGDIVALGTGTYVESVVVDRQIAVVGACSAQTRIVGPEGDSMAVKLVPDGALYLGHGTVEGGERSIKVVLESNAADIKLEALNVEGGGLRMEGDAFAARALLRDLVVRDRSGDGEGARGLSFSGTAKADVEGGWLYTPGGSGIETHVSFRLHVEDLWSEAAHGNAAVRVTGSSTLGMHRVGIANFERGAVDIMGGEVELSDLYLATEADEQWSPYLGGWFGAEMRGEQIYIDGKDTENTRPAVVANGDVKAEFNRLAMHNMARPDNNSQHVVDVGDDAVLELEEALLVAGGISVFRAQLEGRDIVVSAAGASVEERLANGIAVEAAEADLRRLEIGGGLFDYHGIQISGEAQFQGSDIGLRMTPEDDGPTTVQHGGFGAFEGTEVDVARLLVDGAGAGGVSVFSGQVGKTDLVIRNTKGTSLDQWSGHGIVGVLDNGGWLEAERFLVTNNRVSGIGALGGEAVFREGVIADTRVNETTDYGGSGARFMEGADVEIQRVLLRRNVMGALVTDGGVTLHGVDIRIDEVKSSPAEEFAQGEFDAMSVGALITDSRAEGKRWWVSGAKTHGVSLLRQSSVGRGPAGNGDFDTSMTLTDLFVEDIEPHSEEGQWGLGIQAMGATQLELSRGLVSNTRVGGVMSYDISDLELRDVTITGARGRRSDNLFGLGLALMTDTQAQLKRVVIEQSQTVGLSVEERAELEAEDLRVSNTIEAECSVDDCEYSGGGIGLSTRTEAAAKITRFVIENSERAGIQVTTDGNMEAIRGVIRQSQVGVNIEDENISLDEAFDEVYLEDNQQNISSEEIAVPSVAEVFGGL